jgi:trehalose 6-phosphate phosphatase
MSARPHPVTTVPVETALAEAVRVLSAGSSALICDIDGTLSPIAPRPEDATVSPDICRDLERLSRRLRLVAVVTGRDSETAHRMVPVRGLTFVTHYGLTPSRDPAGSGIDEAKLRARLLLDGVPGLVFEEKDLSLALHYRLSNDPAAVREHILAKLLPVVASLGARILEGKMVVEVVPAGLPDKTSAVQRLIAGLRGVVYLGDDLADAPVFRHLAQRREEQDLPSLSIAVVDEETPAAIHEAADITLNGVGAVEALLAALPDALDAAGNGALR